MADGDIPILSLTDAPTLAGPTLRLDSVCGNHIPNDQGRPLFAGEQDAFEATVRAYERACGGAIQRRGAHTARYNCHGLTFAARRTGIYADSVVYQILKEDNYRQVEMNDVLPGDVLLYFDDRGGIDHSAIVVEPPASDPLGIPRVLSKWRFCAELVHPANACPYNFGTARFYRLL